MYHNSYEFMPMGTHDKNMLNQHFYRMIKVVMILLNSNLDYPTFSIAYFSLDIVFVSIHASGFIFIPKEVCKNENWQKNKYLFKSLF